MIALLNGYFVPVYSSNEKDDIEPVQEREERDRILQEFGRAHMSVGTVHVYILSPDGQAIASLHVAAAGTDRLIELLERVSRKLRISPGEPVIAPQPQSVPPPSEPGWLTLHLTARGYNEGSWREFPAENWLTLRPGEWIQLLPAGEVKEGAVWEIDSKVARRLLTNFYPQTEDTSSVDRNKIIHQSLRGRILTVQAGMATARLDATLTMKRRFYPDKEDNAFVNANLVGFIAFASDRRRVPIIELVTYKAIYRDEEFGAALRSVSDSPPATRTFAVGQQNR